MKSILLQDSHREDLRQLLVEYEHDKHLAQLERLFGADSLDLETVLYYGLPYLPNIVDADGRPLY
jgi:hypothetical protein